MKMVVKDSDLLKLLGELAACFNKRPDGSFYYIFKEDYDVDFSPEVDPVFSHLVAGGTVVTESGSQEEIKRLRKQALMNYLGLWPQDVMDAMLEELEAEAKYFDYQPPVN